METKKAFTLIELLVVIAIIGLLLSIILPALSKVKEKAKQLICMTNQRQLAVAINTYVTDNKDNFFPYYSTSTPQATVWVYAIAPYIGDNDQIRLCPQAPIVASDEFPKPILSGMTADALGVASKNGLTFTGNAKRYAWTMTPNAAVEASGSYCLNGYLYTPAVTSTSAADYLKQVAGGEQNLWGKSSKIPTRAVVPMLTDGIWMDFWPIPGEAPIASTTWSKGGYMVGTGNYFSRILINRHNYNVAVNFLDGHSSIVSILKQEPWSLTWRPKWRPPTSTESQTIQDALSRMPK